MWDDEDTGCGCYGTARDEVCDECVAREADAYYREREDRSDRPVTIVRGYADGCGGILASIYTDDNEDRGYTGYEDADAAWDEYYPTVAAFCRRWWTRQGVGCDVEVMLDGYPLSRAGAEYLAQRSTAVVPWSPPGPDMLSVLMLDQVRRYLVGLRGRLQEQLPRGELAPVGGDAALAAMLHGLLPGVA